MVHLKAKYSSYISYAFWFKEAILLWSALPLFPNMLIKNYIRIIQYKNFGSIINEKGSCDVSYFYLKYSIGV